MIASVNAACFQPATEQLQSRFLSILPRIHKHARIYFRNVKCPNKKADRIAETVAFAWQWFVQMANEGKDATRFPSVLANFAARAVKAGRRIAGMLKAKDAMNELTQQRRHFTVGKLPDFSTLDTNPLAEALADNTRTPPPDAAAFRCDFPAWRKTRTHRDRKVINRMMQGDQTLELSRSFGISPARVSQLRRDFHNDWERFCDEKPDVAVA